MRDTIYIVPTLPLSPRTTRLIGALAVALVLVGGAYVLSGPSFFSLKFAGAESNEELLRAYAAKDTDRDGLPDWQEVLYSTDPNVPDTDGDGISDGEAATSGLLSTQRIISEQVPEPVDVASIPGFAPAPGTLTEEFSRTFFESYVSTWKGVPLTQEEQDALIAKLLGDFSGKASAVLSSTYSSASVESSADVSVIAYVGELESVLRRNEVREGEGSPVLLAQAFIENSDRSALPKLGTLARAYGSIATELAALRVPAELSDEHLTLIRSFDTLSNSTDAIAAYEKDPLAVLGALALLQPSSRDMVTTLGTIAREAGATGSVQGGAPGSLIQNFAQY